MSLVTFRYLLILNTCMVSYQKPSDCVAGQGVMLLEMSLGGCAAS